ncbi:MAG: DUF3015 family protein [Nitrospirae bacterium]|nr:DUF3015 family protein [Nitrospirota bacterium]
MKKLLIGVLVTGVLSSGVAYAASQAQSNTGCGLGAVLIGEKGNDSLLGQLAMTLLNGTSANQTFGITSGTSECKAPAKIVKNERLNEFVVANIDNLSKDIAMGNGESLDTMAELMGISIDKRAEVYSKIQANFANIFTSASVEAPQVVDNIAAIIQ